MQSIKIAVFDEQSLFLAGIVHVLNAQAGMEVVAEAKTASAALLLSKEVSPDVVVLDSGLLDEKWQLVRTIAAIPFVKVLILSFNIDASQACAALASGARGYVFKGVDEHQLREAVRAVHRGEGYVSPTVAAEMVLNHADEQKKAKAPSNPLDQLTHREGQILALLSSGMKNQEIGELLNIAERTVKHYVTRIFTLLNVRNRVEAAALSRDRGAACTPKPFHVGHPNAGAHTANRPPIWPNETPSGEQCFDKMFGYVSAGVTTDDYPGTHIVLLRR